MLPTHPDHGVDPRKQIKKAVDYLDADHSKVRVRRYNLSEKVFAVHLNKACKDAKKKVISARDGDFYDLTYVGQLGVRKFAALDTMKIGDRIEFPVLAFSPASVKMAASRASHDGKNFYTSKKNGCMEVLRLAVTDEEIDQFPLAYPRGVSNPGVRFSKYGLERLHKVDSMDIPCTRQTLGRIRASVFARSAYAGWQVTTRLADDRSYLRVTRIDDGRPSLYPA
jgi:hypothetical protein